MILGQLAYLPLAPQIGPAIAHVGNRDPVTLYHGQRQRRAHPTSLLRMLACIAQQHLVGPLDGVFQHAGQIGFPQPHCYTAAHCGQRLGIETARERRILGTEERGQLALERSHRPLAGHLACQLAAHAIRNDEQAQ